MAIRYICSIYLIIMNMIQLQILIRRKQMFLTQECGALLRSLDPKSILLVVHQMELLQLITIKNMIQLQIHGLQNLLFPVSDGEWREKILLLMERFMYRMDWMEMEVLSTDRKSTRLN